MSGMKVFLIALIAALIGVAGGYFFYANTVARFDAMSSVCVTMQEAVRKNLLTTEQVKELGAASGTILKRDYASVAKKLDIPAQSAGSASPDSVCSQFLVGVQQSQ